VHEVVKSTYRLVTLRYHLWCTINPSWNYQQSPVQAQKKVTNLAWVWLCRMQLHSLYTPKFSTVLRVIATLILSSKRLHSHSTTVESNALLVAGYRHLSTPKAKRPSTHLHLLISKWKFCVLPHALFITWSHSSSGESTTNCSLAVIDRPWRHEGIFPFPLVVQVSKVCSSKR